LARHEENEIMIFPGLDLVLETIAKGLGVDEESFGAVG
jgi:hypothetical protein